MQSARKRKRSSRPPEERKKSKSAKRSAEADEEVEELRRQLADAQEKLNEKAAEERVANAEAYLRNIVRVISLFSGDEDSDVEAITKTITSISTDTGTSPGYYTELILLQGSGLNSGRFTTVSWGFDDGTSIAVDATQYHDEYYVLCRWNEDKFTSCKLLPTRNSFQPGCFSAEMWAAIRAHENSDASKVLLRFGVFNTSRLMLASVCVKKPFLDFIDTKLHGSVYCRFRNPRDDLASYPEFEYVEDMREAMFDYPQLVLCAQVTGSIWWGYFSNKEPLYVPKFIQTLLSYEQVTEFQKRYAGLRSKTDGTY